MTDTEEPGTKIEDLKAKYLDKTGMVQTSIYIDKPTYEELVLYSAKVKQKKSTIIKIALMKFFEDMKK